MSKVYEFRKYQLKLSLVDTKFGSHCRHAKKKTDKTKGLTRLAGLEVWLQSNWSSDHRSPLPPPMIGIQYELENLANGHNYQQENFTSRIGRLNRYIHPANCLFADGIWPMPARRLRRVQRDLVCGGMWKVTIPFSVRKTNLAALYTVMSVSPD